MEVSIDVILKMTLYAFFLGLTIGVLYDLIRISRMMIGISYSREERGPIARLYSIEYPVIGRLTRTKSDGNSLFSYLYVGVGDVLFCLLSGSLFCVFLYLFNDGIFRWQAFVFCALGFFAYYNTLGKIVIYFAEFFVIFLRILTKFLAFAIAFPFKIVYNIGIKVVRPIFLPFAAWIVGTFEKLKPSREQIEPDRESTTKGRCMPDAK